MSNNDFFSVLMGIVPPKAMQVYGLDEDARTALYNAVDRLIPKEISSEESEKINFLYHVGEKFFKLKHNTILRKNIYSIGWSYDMETEYEHLFDEDKWYRIFDFIEFIHSIIKNKGVLSNLINTALKQENVGFRFTNGKFISITSDEEMQAIAQAAASSFDNANTHIKKAIALLADRKNPDYANSIKESISAVESLAVEISGEANFDKAIAQLEQNGVPLHPQFAAAIKNMYRFTSDAPGIRHGVSGEPLQCNPATARYMLIICSAMVNFIVASKA